MNTLKKKPAKDYLKVDLHKPHMPVQNYGKNITEQRTGAQF